MRRAKEHFPRSWKQDRANQLNGLEYDRAHERAKRMLRTTEDGDEYELARAHPVTEFRRHQALQKNEKRS